MKEQLKDVRIRIDGLSQLVKELNPEMFILPTSLIPKNIDANDILQFAQQNSQPIFIEESKESVQKINSTETQKCYESLLLANHWLREFSEEIGGIDISNDTSRTELGKKLYWCRLVEKDKPIALLADTYEEQNDDPSVTNVEKVTWIADEIKQLTHLVLELEGGKLDTAIWTDYMHEVKMFAYKHLSEANFWITLELQRIK